MLPALIGLAVLYVIAAVITWRIAAGHFAYTMMRNSYGGQYRAAPKGDHWFAGICLGLPVALLWPIAVLWVKVPWRAGAEREHALERREEHVRELERAIIEHE